MLISISKNKLISRGHKAKPSDIVAHFDGIGKDSFPVPSLSSPESVASLAQMERMGQLYA